jgi:porin
LEGLGITVEGLWRSDFGVTAHGGHCPGGAIIHNVDLGIRLDGERSMGWAGGSVLAQFLYNNGASVSYHAGDAQMVSSLEAAKTVKPYQLWLQQDIHEGALSLLAGLYDLNSEFYVTSSSGLFLNGSFGVGKEFSQTGLNGPSVFPNTAFAVRVKSSLGSEGYLQVAGIDGVPGSPGDSFAPAFRLSEKEGALVIGEAGAVSSLFGLPCRFAAGGWSYTRKVDHQLDWGAYVLVERQPVEESEALEPNVVWFLRCGFAEGNHHEYDYNLGAGLVLRGFLNSGSEDYLGIAMTTAHRSPVFRAREAECGHFYTGGETTVELSYKFPLLSWLWCQGDLQHIIHPGAGAGLANATVLSARIEMRL